MVNSWQSDVEEVGKLLERAIDNFSNEQNADGTFFSVEVKDGLYALGAPIGSKDYCDDFIMKILCKTVAHSKMIIDGLDDYQTILQLFCAWCMYCPQNDSPLCI